MDTRRNPSPTRGDLDLETIVGRLVEALDPERIILFGSVARGEAGPESDLDLLVVTARPPSTAGAWDLAHRVAPELPLQLVFLTPEEWRETRDVIGGLAYPAHREGRVLYAA